MEKLFNSLSNSIKHIQIVNEIFGNIENYSNEPSLTYDLFNVNYNKLNTLIDNLELEKQLYTQKGRQMILSDLIEYILLGRGYYAIKAREDKENFIKLILHFVNLLMSFESMTVDNTLRKKFLEKLGIEIPEIKEEEKYRELFDFVGKVGLKEEISDAPRNLNKYFDSFLPKTAGGLWHELLVYIFLLRNDYGYIIPLLLTQRFIGFSNHIVPPDFLILASDKRIYGIEVGTKKEIQSGSFSLKTAIPTATIDTINSRNSDRCPKCNKWIEFCPFVIRNYSNLSFEINKIEVRCIEMCDLFSREQILSGACPYTKYCRNRAETLVHTHHICANGLHYHYKCVLGAVEDEMKQKIINAADNIALKTHYPFYSGVDDLKINKQ